MRTMFFNKPSLKSKALLTTVMVALLWCSHQSSAQVLNSFAQPGRNRVGSSTYNGTSATGDSYTIVGGGNDIWDNMDEFTYRYTEVSGDFDVTVRVESLTANATWSKAGIMVRESLAEDSRMVFERVTPLAVAACAGGNGANDVRLAYRTGRHINDADGNGDRFNDSINDGRHEDGTGNPAYPNAWLRLTRQGALLTGYSSTDGVTWTMQGTQDTAAWERGAMASTLLVGLGVSRHSGAIPACGTATAEFRDFKITGDSRMCLAAADSLGCPNSILLTFTHPVGAGATDINNYNLAGGDFQNITGARLGNKPNTVILDTDPLLEGALYTVTASNVQDSQGAGVDGNCNAASFTHADGYLSNQVHVVYNKAPAQWDPSYNAGLVGYYFQTLAYQMGLPVATDGQPAHTNNPTYFEDGPTAIVDDDFHETYAARIIGLLQINVDGDYKFAASSDDGGALFLSTDENPANKVQIAREPLWAGTREWNGFAAGEGGRGGNACGGSENQSCPIHLLAGHRYYLEYTVAEGGGGNHAAVTWDAGTGTFPNNGSGMLATDPAAAIWQGKGELVPIRWHNNEIFYNLGPAVITRDLVDQSVPIGRDAVFSLGLDGTPPYTIQWKTNGVVVPGATGTTLTLAGAAQNQGLRVSATVANVWGSATSRQATLTILLNPIILSVGSRGNCHAVYVNYNKPMQLDGTYTLVCSNNVNGTLTPAVLSNVRYGSNQNQVVLTVTPDLQPDTNTYYLTVTGAHSQDGLLIDPNPSTASFVHGAGYPGFNVIYRRYNGVGNGNLAAFIASAKYQNDQADITLFNPTGFFEAPTGVADNYGAKVAGYYIAPQDGNYQFWMSSDDQGATYIATDAVPAHKTQIAAEPSWGGVREWASSGNTPANGGTSGPNGGRGDPPVYNPPANTTGNGSLPIHLTAGQRVYLELLWTEGGGGDNGAVTVVIDPADPNVGPPNGTLPIAQDQFARLRISPDGTLFSQLCDVFCNPGPSDQTVFAGQSATFAASPDGTPPYTIQWKKNGVAIPGANGTSYTTPAATLADEGTVYTFEFSNEFSSTNCSAVLHVRHEPQVLSCDTRGDATRVYVTYNKPVKLDGTYSIADNTDGNFPVDVTGVGYGANQSEVVVSTVGLPPDHCFTLTITGVHDQEGTPGNLLIPDPTICTFAQARGPVCYDFEDGQLPAGTTGSGNRAPYVLNGVLHLTDNGVTGQQNFWTIPLSCEQTIKGLKASWQTLLNGPIGNAADGFSFNVGRNLGFPVAAEEGGNNGLAVTVDTYDNAGAEVGIEVRWNGVQLGFTRVPPGNIHGPAELEKNVFVNANVAVSASGFVTFNYDTYSVSAQIPNYSGIVANQYVFAARTGGAAEDAWIDNVCIDNSVPVKLTIRRNADGSIDVSWTGAGHLEESSSLTPASWSSVSLTSPYHVATPTGMRFYRVVNP